MTDDYLRDLWHLAVHEAGHAVVAEHHGQQSVILFTHNGKGGFDYGSTHRFGKSTGKASREISLAGAIANHIEYGDDLDAIVWMMLGATAQEGNLDFMSESDADGAGNFTVSDVLTVYCILKDRWEDVIARAEIEAGIHLVVAA